MKNDVKSCNHMRNSGRTTRNQTLSEQEKLSVDDVSKLISNPSAEAKAEIAAKMGKGFSPDLSAEERAIAQDILGALVKDVQLKVRKALAESIQDNPDIPHDIALTLANDDIEVALPMLTNSLVLNDDDLKGIIQSKDATYQSAIAGRKDISDEVSGALVDTGNEDVVAALVSNDQANISEITLERVINQFGSSEKVNAPMAQRNSLPISIAERLVNFVSDQVKQHLVTHHNMSPDMAMDLLLASREKATIGLLEGRESSDVIELVKELERNDRLTQTIIIRALCMGDEDFFNASMAVKAGIPKINAYKLTHDEGAGLGRMFQKVGFSEHLVPITRAALKVIAEVAETGGDDKDLLRQLIIERVLTSCEVEFDSENIDYLIGKLGS